MAIDLHTPARPRTSASDVLRRPARSGSAAWRPQDPGVAPWKVGLAAAGLGALLAWKNPGMVAHARWQNVASVALSAGAFFGVGAGTTALARKLDASSASLSSTTSKLALSGMGVATAVAATVALRGRTDHLGLNVLRTAGTLTAGGGLLALGVEGEQRLASRLNRSAPGTGLALDVAAAGALALGTTALLRRPRLTAPTLEMVQRYEQAASVHLAPNAPFDEAGWATRLTQRQALHTVSGGPGSLLPRESLNTPPLRFLNGTMSKEMIAGVLGTSTAGIRDGARIYGGVGHGANHTEQVDNIIAEMDRLGVWDRSHIALVTPSGSGNINTQSIAGLETALKGDVVSVAAQYSDKDTFRSIPLVGKGAQLHNELLRRVSERVQAMPEGSRPKIIEFAESLGSWVQQDGIRSFGGADAVGDAGVWRTLNIGTPGYSALRTELIGRTGQRASADGSMFEFGTLDEVAALTPEQRARTRMFLFSHKDDTVPMADWLSFFRPSERLRVPELGVGMPRTMHHIPIVSGIQNLFDTGNGIISGPGRGHNYGDDVARAWNEVLEAGLSEEQLRRLSAHSFQEGLAEKRGAVMYLAPAA